MRKNGPFNYVHLIILLLVLGIDQAKAVSITSLTQNGSTIGRFEKFELTFTLSQTYSNPFDPCVIDVTVDFHEPGGTVATIPAFYYQYYYTYGSNPEIYTASGSIYWKTRFAPSKLGTHSFDITIKDSGGTVFYPNAGTFTCQDSTKKGFIRIDPQTYAYLKYDSGQTRVNIGQNIAWNLGGIYGWDNYIKKMHNAGENWVRLWNCGYGSDGGVLLEWKDGSYNGYFKGAGKPSMQTSLRLDRYVEIAEQNDVAIQLALQHHGQFSTSVNPDWDGNPYNVNAGGWLTDPAQYFTDANAIRLTKNKYRYIVARWGYSPAIFAWELFNEVQFTNGASSNPAGVVNWHNEMASYIRSIDHFKHPVTTSSYDPSYQLENMWNLVDINLIQVHYYGGETIHSLEQAACNLERFNESVIIGEFGTGTEGGIGGLPEPQRTQMYEGLEMHNGNWSSFHVKSSAHLWWWDIYIDPCNRYPEYTPLVIYAQNENPSAYELSTAQPVIEGAQTIYANPEIWYFDAISQHEFYLQGNCFPGMDRLNKYLHGSWHPAQKSDPNFHLNMPTAGNLKIHVSEVASGGTNRIRVRINGTSVYYNTLTNGSTNFVITIPLSAGQQAVQVINEGQDWIHIPSYEFAPNNPALLNSIGLSSNERAYIWIYDVNSQYGKINNGTFHNQQISVKGLDDGTYNVEVYATRGAGGIIDSGQAVSASGELTYTLPDFEKDIAVKVKPPCIVDLDDLSGLCAQWLLPGPVLAGSGNVDFEDFSVLADYWMEQCPADWPF